MPSQSPPAPATRPEASRPRREPSLDRRPGTKSSLRRLPSWGLIAGALAILAVGAIVIALISSGGDNPKTQIGKPRVVSSQQLSEYTKSSGRTVFWAGPAANGFKLELTEVKGPRVFVRYLTTAAQAGDPRAAYTTVATYPMRDAAARLAAASKRPGAVVGKTGAGATTLYYKKTPSNVYVAQPGSNFLVEVFAPQPRAALELAGSQQLTQVR